MPRRAVLALALLLPLGGCLSAMNVGMLAGASLGTALLVKTGGMVADPVPISAQPGLVGLCNMAMTIAPMAPEIAPWIEGGCGTAEAVVALAADPSSTAWLQRLIGQAAHASAGRR